MSNAFSELRSRLSTVVGITVTPYTEEGGIDEVAFTKILKRAVDAGITAMTPNGNTSEFYSLSREERLRCVELVRSIAPEIVTVAGVGLDFETQVEEAKKYQELGAQAIMLHEPIHPFWSLEGWIEGHRRLAAAVPNLPIIPYIKNPKITPEAIQKLIQEVPAVIAVKYAISSTVQFAATVNLVGKDTVTWICGVAEMHAPFFAVAGAAGFTSGLVNVDPDRSLRMLEALRQGNYDAALKEQEEIELFEQLRARNASEHNVTVVKEALGILGLCRSEVRAPLSQLNDTDRQTVKSIVDSWNITV